MFHTPVLLKEILESIQDHAKIIIDGTFGHGGHSIEIAKKFPNSQIIGIDRDPNIISQAQERIGQIPNIKIIQGTYADIDTICQEQKLNKIDFILLDIGVNMEHFKNKDRGFSIHKDSELDMRFDTTQNTTAQEILNTYSTPELSQIFQEYGDFTKEKSDEIANSITKYRKTQKIVSTKQLLEILGQCGLGKKASTVIFQSIRIQVNQELEQLKIFLERFDKTLNIGGRCSIISYHSIEDRLVKQRFKDLVEKGNYILTNKKAIKASRQEVKSNRASRSAVLRTIEKI